MALPPGQVPQTPSTPSPTSISCVYRTSAKMLEVAESTDTGEYSEVYVRAMTYIWRNAEFALALNGKYYEQIKAIDGILGNADWDPTIDDSVIFGPVTMTNIQNPLALSYDALLGSSFDRTNPPAGMMAGGLGSATTSQTLQTADGDFELYLGTLFVWPPEPRIAYGWGAGIFGQPTYRNYSLETENLTQNEKAITLYDMKSFAGAPLDGCQEIFGVNGYTCLITKSGRDNLLNILENNIQAYLEILNFFWSEVNAHEFIQTPVGTFGAAGVLWSTMASAWDVIEHFNFKLVENKLGPNCSTTAAGQVITPDPFISSSTDSLAPRHDDETLPPLEHVVPEEDETIYKTSVCDEDLEEQIAGKEQIPPEPPKEFCIDWTLADRKAPYFSEKENKYLVSYDVVVEDFAVFKQNVDSYKPDVLQILNNFFNLGIDLGTADPQKIINFEDIYYEPRSFKPSKILFSLSAEDAKANMPDIQITVAAIEAVEAPEPPSTDKNISLTVSKFIETLDTIILKMEKFNYEFGFWKFTTPQLDPTSLQEASAVIGDINKFSLFKTLFYRLFERNGTPLDEYKDSIIKLYFNESSDPAKKPHDLVKVEVSVPSRFTTSLVWESGADEIGGLKANEPFDDPTSVNYLFRLDEISEVISSISWNKFYEQYRVPEPTFGLSTAEDLLMSKGLGLLQDVAGRVVGDILDGLEHSPEDFKLFADKYNKKSFKSLKEKMEEDAKLNSADEIMQRAKLAGKAGFDTGDFAAGSLNKNSPKGLSGQTPDFNTDILNPLGMNFIKFSGLLNLSLVARAIPVEKLQDLNLKQHLSNADPKFLLKLGRETIDAALEAGEDVTEGLQFSVNLMNSMLESTFFDTKTQQLYVDYLRENADPTSGLSNVNNYDELTAVMAQAAENTTIEQSRLTMDFMDNGKIGLPEIQLSPDKIQTAMSDLTTDFSAKLGSAYENFNSDLEKTFQSFANCELPSPDMFSKHKDLPANLQALYGKQGDRKFERIAMPAMPGAASIPNPKKFILEILMNIVTSSFLFTITTLIKQTLGNLNQLVKDSACTQIKALIEQSGALDEGNQLASSIVDEMSKVAPSNQNLTPEEAIGALNDVANSMGLSNGIETADLNKFIDVVSSVLTQREMCDLLKGRPNPDTILIIKNIIEIQFPDSGISSNSEDIRRYFEGIGKFIDPSCIDIISDDDIPINTVFCATAADYKLYADLRCNLLKEKGLDATECEAQLELLADIAECQAKDLLELVNGSNPLGNIFNPDGTNPGGKPKDLIPGLSETIAESLMPLYETIFKSIQVIHLYENVGGRGLVNNILANKNGLAYPIYKNYEALNATLGLEPPNFAANLPTRIATWLRYNASYWACARQNKTTVIPLKFDSTKIDSDDIDSYKELINFSPPSIPTYSSYFEVAGTPDKDLRTLSFYGVPSHFSDFRTTVDEKVVSYNFNIIPYEPQSLDHQINTKVIDYIPLIFNPPDAYDRNDLGEDLYYKVNKNFKAEEYIKAGNDYLIDVNSDLPPLLNMDRIGALNTAQTSYRSFVFAEIILSAMVNNLGFDPNNITKDLGHTLDMDVFNFVYNSFLDGFMKLPTLNDKNFLYGITDKQMNLLNSTHKNTVTNKLAPVVPEDFDGTEVAPTAYFYNKLDDTYINFYDSAVLDSESQFAPLKSAIPSFIKIAKDSADLSSKLKDETRTADDLTNQAPFDLIIPKNSMAAMDGLITSFVRTMAYEHFIKAFPLLNTVEYNNSVFDSVHFQFLKERLKEELLKAGVKYQGVDKKKEFMRRFLEINATLMLKKQEQNIGTFTQRETEFLSQVLRKANIWRYGIPSKSISPVEATYFNAYSKISSLETPNYPGGVFRAAIMSGKSGDELASAFARAKSNREKQIEVRNFYWNRIMADTEDICFELLETRFKEEFVKITDQFSMLNTSLTRLNNILYTPLVGGPTVQASETDPAKNVFKKSPAFLASIHDKTDYNINGFIITSFDNIINSGPKEPVSISPYALNTSAPSSLFHTNASSQNTSQQENASFLLDSTNQEFPIAPGVGASALLEAYKSFSTDQFGYTQNTIPFRVEKYLRLEPYGDPNDASDPQLAKKLYAALYDDIQINTNFGIVQGYEKTVFTGPVGLSNLWLYLDSNGFFNNLSTAEKITSLNKLFKNIKFGLRLNILQFGGFPMVSSSRTVKWAEEKCFHSDHQYPVPLFVEEMDLSPGFLLSHVANFEDTDDYREPLEKSYIQELMDRMVCSKDYKVFFDYCIPLRYFMSLSAIYHSKGFISSIGSKNDWNSEPLSNMGGLGFDSYDSANLFKRTRRSIRSLLTRSYMSFIPGYRDEEDKREKIRIINENLSSQISPPIIDTSEDALASDGSDMIETVMRPLANALAANMESFQDTYNSKSPGSDDKKMIENLATILPPMSRDIFIKDPTNIFGNVFDEPEED